MQIASGSESGEEVRKFFQRVAARAPVGLLLCDEDGGVVAVNARWCGMSGLAAHEAAGDGWQQAVHPDDREGVVAKWREAVRARAEFRGELRFHRPDGRETWIEMAGWPVPDAKDGEPVYAGSCTEAVERRKSEARMRLFEEFLGSTPDFAYVFDRRHRFIYANAALLTMWGKTWDECAGRSLAELGYEPWLVEMHEREIDEVFETGELRRGEVPFTGTHGRRIYEYIFNPVFGEDGEVEAVAGTTRDVTERRQAEDRANLLNKLAGNLASLATEQDIVRTAAEALGRYLGVQRCYFVECLKSENLLRVGVNWAAEGEEPLGGEFRLSDFGGEEWWRHYSGGNHAVEDVRTNPLTAPMARSYERLGVRAYAVQPFKRLGPWKVVLGVTTSQPRKWTREEMELIENVIARVWPLVEQCRALEAMRQSQQRLALVADNLPAVVSLVGADHRFVYGNERCHKWFDFPGARIEGVHLRDAMGDEAYRHRLPFLERVLAGETVGFETTAEHRELGPRALEVLYTPDRAADGSVRGFFVMATDITDRKAAEAASTHRNEGRRLLAEAGRVILSSDSPSAIWHRMCETVSGHLEADICIAMAPGDAGGEGARVELGQGIGEGIILKLGESYFSAADATDATLGDRLAVADRRARELLAGEGVQAYACEPLLVGEEVLGILIFASRTRGEFSPAEIEFIDSLSQYVTGAQVRLRLVESLRESDRRKDQFLATLAHELRNPLAPILTGLDVMKRSSGNVEVMERITSIIERQAGQMVHLIDDLLDMSRVNTGKIILKKTEQPLVEIIKNAIEASQPMIEEREHVLDVRLPSEEAVVDVDPSRVAQVVSNLLSNAAKYTPPGGRIEVAAGTDGADAWVKVRDNGLGIEPAEQQSIFELFQQSANGSADGLGIGLTLVKSLVELHGGAVTVRSEGKGKGSEFQVRLPGCVVVPEPSENPAVEPETPSVPPRKRVLVVDDGKNAADMLALFFRLEGMEVAVAYDGREGVEKARAFDPDLVMMDLGMPLMDGLEAARQMRAENVRGKLVALSGWGRDEDKQRTAEAGFDHHVVKPVCPDDLRAIMERFFGSGNDRPPAAEST